MDDNEAPNRRHSDLSKITSTPRRSPRRIRTPSSPIPHSQAGKKLYFLDFNIYIFRAHASRSNEASQNGFGRLKGSKALIFSRPSGD